MLPERRLHQVLVSTDSLGQVADGPGTVWWGGETINQGTCVAHGSHESPGLVEVVLADEVVDEVVDEGCGIGDGAPEELGPSVGQEAGGVAALG